MLALKLTNEAVLALKFLKTTTIQSFDLTRASMINEEIT